jgi:hypothetical protein
VVIYHFIFTLRYISHFYNRDFGNTFIFSCPDLLWTAFSTHIFQFKVTLVSIKVLLAKVNIVAVVSDHFLVIIESYCLKVHPVD